MQQSPAKRVVFPAAAFFDAPAMNTMLVENFRAIVTIAAIGLLMAAPSAQTAASGQKNPALVRDAAKALAAGDLQLAEI